MDKILTRLSTEEHLYFANKNDSVVPINISVQLPRLLTLDDAFDNNPVTRSCSSVLVSKTRSTLNVMAAKGDYSLPFYKSGRSVRYRLGDIKTYLTSKKLHNISGDKQ